MKRCTVFRSIIFVLTCWVTMQATIIETPKQKVLILSCKGGNGHKKAAEIVNEILAPHYTTKTVYPFSGPLKKLDFMRTLSIGFLDGEDMYNVLLNRGYTRTIDLFTKMPTKLIMSLNFHRMKRCFTQFFLDEQPDVIVSVAPWFNAAAAAAAAKLHIPYLCTALDFDLKMWLHDFDRMQHPAFALTIAEKTPHIAEQIATYKVDPTQIHAVGPFAKNAFYTLKDRPTVRSILNDLWHFPADKPVVMVMMGGAGSQQQLQRITTTLIKADLPVHLAVCVGRDAATGRKLRTIDTKKSRTSLSVIDFTNNVPALMQVADVIIARGGGVTCLELLVTKLPVIFDQTVACMSWERVNIEHFVAQGYGTAFTSFDQLPELVTQQLGKRTLNPVPDNSFPQKLLDLITTLKQQQAAASAAEIATIETELEAVEIKALAAEVAAEEQISTTELKHTPADDYDTTLVAEEPDTPEAPDAPLVVTEITLAAEATVSITSKR